MFRVHRLEIFSVASSVEPSFEKKNKQSGFPTSSDTNQPVQSQKKARSLRFWIKERDGLYCLCSENKGTYQLRGY